MNNDGTRVLSVDDPEALTTAAAALRSERAVLMPTDTVYGLAAVPTTAGLDRLFALKDRPRDRSIAILVASIDQVEEVALATRRDRQLMQAFWPGPLTLVLPRTDRAVAYGASDGTVGVRCPGNKFVRSLAQAVGPLAVTSANRSGRPTPLHAQAAADDLAGSATVIIDGGPCDGTPSSVVRCDPDGVHVFRQGTLDAATLNAALATGLP